MANDSYEYENLQEIEYGGLKIIVEAARRDGEGNTISETYAKKADVQTNLRPGIDIININGQSILRNGNLDVYNKDEIDTKFNAVKTIQFRIVSSLPETGEAHIIYLVPENDVDSESGVVYNLYREYIYVDDQWEVIGRKEENLNFKTINGQQLLITSEQDETDIDTNLHLQIVRELPDALVAAENTLYLIERDGRYDVYGRLDSMEWAQINTPYVDLSEVNDRLDTIEENITTLQNNQGNVDLSSVEETIDSLTDRVETLENKPDPVIPDPVTKVSELENDSGYITINDIPSDTSSSKPWIELQTGNLDAMENEGKYKIANATNYPTGGSNSGSLRIEKINDSSFDEEWISDNIRAYRSATIEEADQPTFTTSLFVNGTEYTESPVTLEPGSEYEISGTLNGKIIISYVSTEDIGETKLILNNVKINNPTISSTIDYEPEHGKLVVELPANSKNFIYNMVDEAQNALTEGAGIYSSADLIIGGVGGLSIKSNTGLHGIRGSDVVIGGNTVIHISAGHDCIHASKSVNIQYGKLLLENGNDGIEAKNGEATRGIVQITGGDITIKNCNSTSIHSTLPGVVCGPMTKITFENNRDRANGVTFLEDVTLVGEEYTKTSFADFYGPAVLKYRTERGFDGNGNKVYSYTEFSTVMDSSSNTEYYKINVGDEDEREIVVSGYVDKRIYILTKATLILDNACIMYSGDNSAITYNLKSSRLAIKCESDTVNYIYQSHVGSTSTALDYDAIKSENNIEITGKGILIAKSNHEDAIDGSGLSIKGDGARYFINSGLRGIKSTRLYLGGEKYVTDNGGEGGSSASTVYSSIYALGNNTLNDEDDGSDIYCRNGSNNKGYYIVYPAYHGYVICDTFKSFSGQLPDSTQDASGLRPQHSGSPIYVTIGGVEEQRISRHITQYSAINPVDIYAARDIIFTDWKVFYAIPSMANLDITKNYVLGISNGHIGWVVANSIGGDSPIEDNPIPSNAVYDDNGNVFVDIDGNYLVIGD